MEACASLSRAVWYLEERHSGCGSRGHGRVRCSNVFVSQHSDAAFQVKLGDAGLMGEPYPVQQVHWLPYELLLMQGSATEHAPSPMNCTVKGDVWALATTFWEVCVCVCERERERGKERTTVQYSM